MPPITDNNVIRFHLQVIHGITVKECPRRTHARTLVLGSRLFGVSLENVPRCFVTEFGLVPCFLVDACAMLLERAGTVGLFRKTGSLIRIKALKAKLNGGEGSLSAALPYDVAALVKCFCRELPQPLFPLELQEALLQAQALPSQSERTSALQLLSCMLPARNYSLLHYLFTFLWQVSQRCAENLMTSSNLAVVFTPCLLMPADASQLSDGQLDLSIAVLRTFIDCPRMFGVIPKDVMDSMSFLFGARRVGQTPSKKRCKKRYSLQLDSESWVSDVRTPDPPPSTSRPLKRSLGLESFPNLLLFRTYAPHPGHQQGFKGGNLLLNHTGEDRKDGQRTPQQRLKRLCRLARSSRSQDAGNTPVLTGVGKLKCPAAWRRCST